MKYKDIQTENPMDASQESNSRISTYIHKKLDKRDELSKISVKDLLNLDSVRKDGSTILLTLSNSDKTISLKESSFAKVINTRLKEGLRSKGITKASLSEANVRSVITKILKMESHDDSQLPGDAQVALLQKKSSSKSKTYDRKSASIFVGAGSIIPAFLLAGPTLGGSMLAPIAINLFTLKNQYKRDNQEKLSRLYSEKICFHHPKEDPLSINFSDTHPRTVLIDLQSTIPEINYGINYHNFKDPSFRSNQSKYSNILSNTQTLIKDAIDSINHKCTQTEANDELKEYLINSLQRLVTENILNNASDTNPYYLENEAERNQLIREVLSDNGVQNPLIGIISSVDLNNLGDQTQGN
ncbi:hypothetical protein HOG98_08880 [bacterium]|jgi:hypothetical protein|nr:hypothetical protein [bacterium]